MLALLGFDASSPALRDALIAEGRLPALAGLLARGPELRLRTPATWLAAASFPTLWSGIEPGDHGLHYPFQWCASGQRIRPASAFPAPEAFWERIARAGRRVLVVDPYEARPMRDSSAVILSGVGFTNRVTLQRWSSAPAALKAAERGQGRGPAADEVFGQPSPGALRRLHGRLLAAPDRTASLVCDALASKPPDLLVCCLPSVHLGGHQFWSLERADGGLPALYEAADAALARIIASLPPGADIIVFSPLGMATNTSRADLLPAMLDAVLTGRRPEQRRGGDSLWRLRAKLPTDLRASVARMLPDRVALELTARLDLRGIDWSRTRAFTVPNDHHGFIRLNLTGRERDGIVSPGEVGELVAELAAGLATFHDPDGTASVATVERTADVIEHGARSGQLPDLVVRFAETQASSLDRVVSPVFGEVVRHGAGSGREGNHTDEAWALLAPGASRLRTPAGDPRLTDLGATAAALLVGDIAGLAGEPLLEPA